MLHFFLFAVSRPMHIRHIVHMVMKMHYYERQSSKHSANTLQFTSGVILPAKFREHRVPLRLVEAGLVPRGCPLSP